MINEFALFLFLLCVSIELYNYITETIYCISFHLSDVIVRMICETGLMTEN